MQKPCSGQIWIGTLTSRCGGVSAGRLPELDSTGLWWPREANSSLRSPGTLVGIQMGTSQHLRPTKPLILFNFSNYWPSNFQGVYFSPIPSHTQILRMGQTCMAGYGDCDGIQSKTVVMGTPCKVSGNLNGPNFIDIKMVIHNPTNRYMWEVKNWGWATNPWG